MSVKRQTIEWFLPERLRPSPPTLPESIGVSEICHIIRVPRRRHVLDYLDRNEPEATLSEVTEYISAIENGGEELGVGKAADRKRVRIALYQSHLPPMADMQIIEAADPNDDVVRHFRRGRAFRAAVDVMRNVEGLVGE